MAKKRKFVAYRRLERPYTRKSKYREKSFIRASPTNRIIRHQMGNPHKDYFYKLTLISDRDLQIRDLALESMRLIINRHCEKKIGKTEFYAKIRVYPHHHLRENALASGAGADRLSTGMKCSFGKVVGIAAQIKKGQAIAELLVDKRHLALAKDILRMGASKLPCSPKVLIETLEQVEKTAEEKRLSEEYKTKIANQDALAAEKAEAISEKAEDKPAAAQE